ncbi:hypothetical protein [Butyrivibrio sp. INlla16]|uniref:hypothetical protein n=1 Tax=Butyrivibrio sp. INlla16 TaxID=1520807 RepID=UPI0008807D34|nr:hypothetical protein [Butyrivibrio sp. INlla16]SDB14997.1 hypothetical protein SAMN02910263_00720 [Butyrivibrio sp. INlla16]
MQGTIRKKLNNKGESLAETLVALLIAALALMMLPGAIAAATRADLAAREESVYYEDSGSSTGYDNGVSVDSFTIN